MRSRLKIFSISEILCNKKCSFLSPGTHSTMFGSRGAQQSEKRSTFGIICFKAIILDV